MITRHIPLKLNVILEKITHGINKYDSKFNYFNDFKQAVANITQVFLFFLFFYFIFF